MGIVAIRSIIPGAIWSKDVRTHPERMKSSIREGVSLFVKAGKGSMDSATFLEIWEIVQKGFQLIASIIKKDIAPRIAVGLRLTNKPLIQGEIKAEL